MPAKNNSNSGWKYNSVKLYIYILQELVGIVEDLCHGEIEYVDGKNFKYYLIRDMFVTNTLPQ